jgi:hypothetical protein
MCSLCDPSALKCTSEQTKSPADFSKGLFSTGGSGSGTRQFRQSYGVAFFDKTIYVADRGNNRIVRFKLSSDLQ